MPADQDLLFGKIAVDLGFCTAEHVDACLVIQEAATERMSLGHHLIREGHLTEDQHSKILERQRRNLKREDPRTRVAKDELLFGRIAVREGMATEGQVNDALREQGKLGERRSLGEVLMAREVLSAAEVQWILGRQSKWIMRCARCAVTFTVHSTSRTPNKANCPRCQLPLEHKELKTEASSMGEVDTSVMQAPPPKSASGSGKCRICDHPFISDPASDGRVECLSCRVRFVP